jgi:hypothetical protein
MLHMGRPMRVSSATAFSFALPALLVLGVGCSGGSDSSAPAPGVDADAGAEDVVAANLAIGDPEYQQAISDIGAAYDTCVAAGQCQELAGVDGGITIPQSVRLQGASGVTYSDGLISTVSGLVSSVPNHICQVLAPIQDYQQVFFFIGGSIAAGSVVQGQVGGDEVWDLWDQQSAGFYYYGGGLGTLVGVGASVYTGLGFGKNKANVIDAWSGYFSAATVGLKTPAVNFGLSASAFVGSHSADFSDIDTSIVGGAISVDAGFNLNAFSAFGVTGAAITNGLWTPYNPATEALGSIPWWGIGGSSTKGMGTASDNKSYEYIQYGNSRSTAYSLIGTTGPLGATAASVAVALGVLKAHNWTVKSICGAGATADAGGGGMLH